MDVLGVQSDQVGVEEKQNVRVRQQRPLAHGPALALVAGKLHGADAGDGGGDLVSPVRRARRKRR